MKKKSTTIIVLIAEFILLIGAIYAMYDDVNFLVTKRQTMAKVISIEKLNLPKPYKVTLEYYNEYKKQNVISHIGNIDGVYGSQLLNGHDSLVSVFYKSSDPKEIFFVDYNHPTFGGICIYIVLSLIMIVGIFLCIKELNNKR